MDKSCPWIFLVFWVTQSIWINLCRHSSLFAYELLRKEKSCQTQTGLMQWNLTPHPPQVLRKQYHKLNFLSQRTDSSRLSPLTGLQAGIGGCHLPWWHLDTRTLMWYPGSQNKWMELFWGKPRHGDGSQRKPPCSGTRGWVQLFSRPAEAQMRAEGDVNSLHLCHSLMFIFLIIKTAFPMKPSSFLLLLQLCSTAPHAFVFFWL